MAAAARQRVLSVLVAGGLFALVAFGHAVLEQPGLGIGHLFYLPIAIAALATDSRVGAAVGLLAALLYVVGVLVNPELASSQLVTVSTAIRTLTYVSSGVLIGWFAHTNRDLLARMRELAETDSLTALPNVRRFESELARHCREGASFAVLIGDLDGLKETNDRDGHAAGNTLLRRAAAALHELARSHDLVARIGGDEFALLARVESETEATALCGALEAELERRRVEISFGWAVHGVDGRTPAELQHRADERLYRSKASRKSRASVVALLTGSALPQAS